MRKVLVIILALLVMASSGVISCAPKEAGKVPQEELLPCKLKLIEVTTAFAGKESIALAPVLSESNPNTIQVVLTIPEYSLSGEGELLGTAQFIDKVYVPAKTEIKLCHTFSVALGDLVGKLLMSNPQPMGQAMASLMPLWKALGGVLPVDALKEVWDKAPAKCLFKVAGIAHMDSQQGELEVPFEVEWQAAR